MMCWQHTPAHTTSSQTAFRNIAHAAKENSHKKGPPCTLLMPDAHKLVMKLL
jgi:hypothetical protein